MHVVTRELLLGRVSFFFDVRGDGTFEFPVRFPADLEIDSVEGAGLDRWWREGDKLTFSTSTPIRGKFQPTVRFRCTASGYCRQFRDQCGGLNRFNNEVC